MKLTSYVLLAAAALLLLGSAQAEARKYVGVNPFCRTASYRRTCTQMVNGATNWQDAVVNAIKATRELAARLQAMVPVVIEPAIAKLEPASRDSVRETCAETYGSVVEDLDVGLSAFAAGDLGTAKTHLSAAIASECADALKEFGIGDEFVLTKYSNHLTRRVDNCLAVILQI